MNGGAVQLSSGSHVYRDCTFTNNFAMFQGGHISVSSSPSTSLHVIDSTFVQHRAKSLLQAHVYHLHFLQTFVFFFQSFIDSQSAGPLFILNSTLNSSFYQDGPNTMVTVSKGNYVNFGENDQTSLKCPRGSRLEITNMSTTIDTYYKSVQCDIILVVLKFVCKPCWVNTYSLRHGQSLGFHKISGFRCLPCPFGAECVNRIAAKPNFWGYKVKGNLNQLQFTLCPLGYCKQPDKQHVLDYNSCHGNRTGWLCGQCKNNYTETLLSPSCRHDNECRDTWVFGMAVVMTMLMALYMVRKPGLLRMLYRHIIWFRRQDNVRHDNVRHDQSKQNDGGGGYLKIFFYFYQVANLLIVSSSYNTIVE